MSRYNSSWYDLLKGKARAWRGGVCEPPDTERSEAEGGETRSKEQPRHHGERKGGLYTLFQGSGRVLSVDVFAVPLDSAASY